MAEQRTETAVHEGTTLLGTVAFCPRAQRACRTDVWVARDTEGKRVGGAMRHGAAADLLRRRVRPVQSP